MKKIKNIIWGTIIKILAVKHFCTFKTKDGHSYRVTSFYYCYTFKDGTRKLIAVPKIFANTIGGYGVCGWYIPFSQVKSISYKFNKARWFFYKNETERNEMKTLWFYFWEKQGKDHEYFIEKAVKETMKNF